MGLHAQAFAAMPLRPALSDVISDLLDEERHNSPVLALAEHAASAAGMNAGGIEEDAPQAEQPQGSGLLSGKRRRAL